MIMTSPVISQLTVIHNYSNNTMLDNYKKACKWRS